MVELPLPPKLNHRPLFAHVSSQIGADFLTKEIEVDDKTVTMQASGMARP